MSLVADDSIGEKRIKPLKPGKGLTIRQILTFPFPETVSIPEYEKRFRAHKLEKDIKTHTKRNPMLLATIREDLALAALQLPRNSRLLNDKNAVIRLLINREKQSGKYREYAKYIKKLTELLHLPSDLTTLNYNIAVRCISTKMLNDEVIPTERNEYYSDFAKALVTHYTLAKDNNTLLKKYDQWKSVLGMHLISSSVIQHKDLQKLIYAELDKYDDNDMLGNSKAIECLTLYAAWYLSIDLMSYKWQHAKGAAIEAIIKNMLVYDKRHMLTKDPLLDLDAFKK